MNYLAHAYLSYSEQQLVGNLIADFVKNNERQNLPIEIQKGIRLHRSIDTFTDAHPIISEAKKIFSPTTRLYAGAFVDVSFDYFLANNHHIKTPKDWENFAENTYDVLQKNWEFLPENFQKILPNMRENNWLYHYRFDWGIGYSFKNVLHKAKFLNPKQDVFSVFIENKKELESYFDAFFPELQQHCINVQNQL